MHIKKQMSNTTHLSCCPWECWCWAGRRRSSVWTAEFWLPERYSTRPWSAWMPNTASTQAEKQLNKHILDIQVKYTYFSQFQSMLVRAVIYMAKVTVCNSKMCRYSVRACGTCSVCALGCNPDTRLSTCRRGTGSRFFMSEGNRSWM